MNNKIGIVRLESLRIKDFKNINNGEIYFSEKKKVQRGDIDEDDFNSVLGIYGQNGSGKTSCLNALRVIQKLLSANRINPMLKKYINVNSESSKIEVDFLINICGEYFYVIYSVHFGVVQGVFQIIDEELSFKKGIIPGKCEKIYSYNTSKKVNRSFLNLLGDHKETYNLMSSYDSKCLNEKEGFLSTIFNPKLYDLVVIHHKKEFNVYSKIITALRVFATSRMSIYSINYFNDNSNLGIRLRCKTEVHDEKTNGGMIYISCKDYFVRFDAFRIELENYHLLDKTINIINKVLPSIIPNYKIKLNPLPLPFQSVISDGANEYKYFSLLGIRNGKPISLEFESNGIKKIISLLSGLIEAYTNEGNLMVIDEIDAGVFEYLLGEIIYVFDNFSNGQLIFTSHNMRILEKISYKNVFFTTIDSNNVFVQLKDVKTNNNLRDLYYRYIANGDKEGHIFFDPISIEELVSNFNASNEDEDDQMLSPR